MTISLIIIIRMLLAPKCGGVSGASVVFAGKDASALLVQGTEHTGMKGICARTGITSVCSGKHTNDRHGIFEGFPM